jgi:hypothetical protein
MTSMATSSTMTTLMAIHWASSVLMEVAVVD